MENSLFSIKIGILRSSFGIPASEESHDNVIKNISEQTFDRFHVKMNGISYLGKISISTHGTRRLTLSVKFALIIRAKCRGLDAIETSSDDILPVGGVDRKFAPKGGTTASERVGPFGSRKINFGCDTRCVA